MKMNAKEYADFVRRRAPKSPIGRDMLRAFWVGGAICCVGQGLNALYTAMGAAKEAAGSWTSVTLVFLGALLTGLGVYDRFARYAGAGTLVPITGFANSVAAPSLEFRTEGLITGTAVKMFTIAGPVLVCGTLASAVYGAVILLLRGS